MGLNAGWLGASLPHTLLELMSQLLLLLTLGRGAFDVDGLPQECERKGFSFTEAKAEDEEEDDDDGR